MITTVTKQNKLTIETVKIGGPMLEPCRTLEVFEKLYVSLTLFAILKGTVMQIEKALIYDRLRVSKAS